MGISVFVDGAAGTTGLEIVDRLSTRKGIELVTLEGDARKDAAMRRQAMGDSDFTILCLPDDAAREAVAMAEGIDARIIDASSAHRTAEGWTYGFPELTEGQRDAIAKSSRVSNPGCYPTGFLALVAPLVARGLLPADWPFTVNAVSGYSGGGKALIERFQQETDIAWRGYGFDLAHKHLPEMQAHAGLEHGVIFAPAVVPAFRGMVAEVPLHLGVIDDKLTPHHLRDALREHYSGSPVITVAGDDAPGELLLRHEAAPSDGLQLSVFGNPGGYHARLVAVLDNLGKGASGAAVQNLNIMAGLPETEGLAL